MQAVEAVLHRHAEDGDRPLVEVMAAEGGATVSYTYRELTRAARSLADRLVLARGPVRAGRGPMRVGVVCGDTPEFVVTELALLALRATGCPVPPGASPRLAAALLADTDAVVVDAPGRARLAAWGPRRVISEGCPVILAKATELAATAAGAYRPPVGTDDWICKVLPGSGRPGRARVGVRAHAVATLLDSLRAEIPAGAFARCMATVSPGALTQQVAGVHLVLLDQGCLVLPPPDAGPEALPHWLTAARPTALAVTPALAVALIGAARTARREGRPVASAVFGTADVPLLWCGPDVPDSLLRELEGLGVPVYAGYGLPENTSVVSWNTPGPGGRRTGTVGRPLAHVRTGIGAGGELLVNSAALADDLTPEDWRTGRAVIDGWLHTGVRATVDADGFITLVDPPQPEGSVAPHTPEIGHLLCSLVRSMRPESVVEFGGGVTGALDELASGARANGTGRVTGYVADARRAAEARGRLASSGLARWAEVLDADVHRLGRPPTGGADTVDLALLDCRPELLLPALTVLEPRMRPGTIVIAVGPGLTGPYLDRVRDGGDYLSIVLPFGTGIEVSTRLTRPRVPDRRPFRQAPGCVLPGPSASFRQLSGE